MIVIKIIGMVLVIVLASLLIASFGLLIWYMSGDDGRVERQLEEERKRGKQNELDR